jgi:hypothetical protein
VLAISTSLRAEQTTRKPGRPRKFETGRHNVTVRFTPGVYGKLKQDAADEGRSISEQVEFRVQEAHAEPKSFLDLTLTALEKAESRIKELASTNCSASARSAKRPSSGPSTTRLRAPLPN